MVCALMIIRSNTLIRPMATFYGVMLHGLFGLRRQEEDLRRREQGHQGELMGVTWKRAKMAFIRLRGIVGIAFRYLPM